MTHFDYSVLKQQVIGLPPDVICVTGLCGETAFRNPRRAGWQNARSASELSYHWHQVSWRCHVFILWEFNPPFRADQALRRCREAVQIGTASHASFWEYLEKSSLWMQMCSKEWSWRNLLQLVCLPTLDVLIKKRKPTILGKDSGCT